MCHPVLNELQGWYLPKQQTLVNNRYLWLSSEEVGTGDCFDGNPTCGCKVPSTGHPVSGNTRPPLVSIIYTSGGVRGGGT